MRTIVILASFFTLLFILYLMSPKREPRQNFIVNENFGSDNGWYMDGGSYWDGWPI